jgi:hypothetical protein
MSQPGPALQGLRWRHVRFKPKSALRHAGYILQSCCALAGLLVQSPLVMSLVEKMIDFYLVGVVLSAMKIQKNRDDAKDPD